MAIEKLQELRDKVDDLDNQLLALCAKRFELVNEIKKIKQSKKLPAFDQARYEAMTKERLLLAEELNLPQEFVIHLFDVIYEEALRLQGDL